MNRIFRSIVLVAAACLCASKVQAQAPASLNSEIGVTLFDYQVEQQVKVKNSRSPVYPERLRALNTDGEVLVQFVVDERGVPQMSTFKVIKSTDPEFSDAVRRAVSSTSFTPAEVRGLKVKQLVQQPYVFAVHNRK
jgi:periplasmic protein TonB